MRLLLAIALALLAAGPAGAICWTTDVDASFSQYYKIGKSGKVSSIHLEPNAGGAGGSATVTLKMCSANTATACSAYNYDSDGDGVEDTNVLTASTTATSGVKDIWGFQYLLVEIGTAAGAGETPRVTFCEVSG